VKILVTGDAGKLGSLVSRRLAKHHTVVGIDIKRGEDLFNRAVLREKVKGCQCIVHAAGLPYPGLGSFGAYFWTNAMGTLRVANAAVEAKTRRIIFLSSTAYYGCGVRKGIVTPLYFPLDEQHPAGVGSHVRGQYESYDLSKIIAEQVLSYFGTNKLIEVVVLRLAPANTKAQQYPTNFDWRTDDTYCRGAFFTNCTPSTIAPVVERAVELEGPYWYSVFNIADRFTHKSIDVREFLKEEYPNVEVRGTLMAHDSLLSIDKARAVLGFQPCEDLS